jgi:hypothetical protein
VTKTQERTINAEIRALRARGRAIVRGRFLPWGVPWCPGPGRSSLCHQPDPCEGCMGREFCAEQAAHLVPRILGLEAMLAPAPTQGSLF